MPLVSGDCHPPCTEGAACQAKGTSHQTGQAARGWSNCSSHADKVRETEVMTVQICASCNWHLNPKFPWVLQLPECFPLTQAECQRAGGMLGLMRFPVLCQGVSVWGFSSCAFRDVIFVLQDRNSKAWEQRGGTPHSPSLTPQAILDTYPELLCKVLQGVCG